MTSTLKNNNRFLVLDALRGFALLGIHIVNIQLFASPYPPQSDPNFTTGWDQAVRLAIGLLFATKFYLVFAFVFGYSQTTFISTMERSGRRPLPPMCRRLLGLAMIGATHAVLLFRFDILTTYAVVGFALMPMRKWSRKRLFGVAIALVLSTSVITLLAGLLGKPSEANLRQLADFQVAQDAYLKGGTSVIEQNVKGLNSAAIYLGIVQAPCALAASIIGLIAARRDALAQPERYRHLLRALIVGGVVVGLPGALVYALETNEVVEYIGKIPALAIGLFTAPWLAAAYLATAILVFTANAESAGVKLLAQAGRLSLTNYLMQSVACAGLFYGYGFGLMGSVSPSTATFLALTIFCGQLACSRLWHRYFAFGPVEWCLRVLTHGVPQGHRSGVGS